MEARLIKTLLRCVQSDADRFAVTAVLGEFVADYGSSVGTLKGKSVHMTSSQKQTIRELLASEGVAADTSPDAWNGLSRAEALALGNNEKFAREPLRRRRVAIKPLRPGLPLVLGGRELFLPAKSHVEVDCDDLGSLSQHDWIIVVENWECFNDIHLAADHLPLPGRNPLVVWRGDKECVRVDAMLALLRNLSQPVAAFVDYDPSGMVIAQSLPRLACVVAPPNLSVWMKRGLHDRYMAQLPGCQATLDRVENPDIAAIWAIIRTAGRALPQEVFLTHHRNLRFSIF